MHYLMRGLQDSGFRASLARSLGDTTTGELQSAVICFPGGGARARAAARARGGAAAHVLEG